MGIEPTPSAWKAEVLPLNYTRLPGTKQRQILYYSSVVVEGGGFEPPKAEPSDLQSDPVDRLGTPPKSAAHSRIIWRYCQYAKRLKTALFED